MKKNARTLANASFFLFGNGWVARGWPRGWPRGKVLQGVPKGVIDGQYAHPMEAFPLT